MSASTAAWEQVQLARHPQRPRALDYIQHLCTDFVELHGDRRLGDDGAIVGGPATLGGRTVVLVGQQKGRTTREQVRRNFGMPHPEGYRKALRLFRYAEKFGFPLICLIDTPGASPDQSSEERGQAMAIAENILALANLRVPVVAVVIGEGGSGGALAIGLADRLLMLEHAIYSVASPEACATILWHDAAQAPQAAQALRLTAPDLLALGLADAVIPEPPGGAHADPRAACLAVGAAVEAHLAPLLATDLDMLLARRYDRYCAIGQSQSRY